LPLNQTIFRREDRRTWWIEGGSDERRDRKDTVRAGDGGGREERSEGVRVVDAFTLSDAISNSASEFEL
jgi:hypothetical protein